jgi:hypothetical protein
MNGPDAALYILWAAFFPASLFPIVYGLFHPWYRSLLGWALFTSSVSLGALIDINLIYRLTGLDLLARDGAARNWIYLFIAVGAWMMLGALGVIMRQGIRSGRRYPIGGSRDGILRP